MKKIRKSVFETNSSSTHSVIIEEGDLADMPKDLKSLDIFTGEYGWEYCRYKSFWDKASYALTYAINYGSKEDLELLDKVLKKYFPNAEITYEELSLDQILKYLNEQSGKFGYIDHQSIDEAATIFEDEDTLSCFLFSKNSYFITDNDNG